MFGWFARAAGPARNVVVRQNGEILLYGVIGDWWDGLDSSSIIQAVDQLGEIDKLVVRINSPGGLVHEGMAIFNFLKDHPAAVTIRVDGLAASIASIVALAGDEIIMGKGSMMMIHNPWNVVWGDADALRQEADVLEKITGQLVGIYAEATGKSEPDILAKMEAETWMTDEEAVAEGFATAVAGADASAEPVDDAAAQGRGRRFDLSIFDNVPEAADRFDDPNGWRPKKGLRGVRNERAAGAVERQERSNSMPDDVIGSAGNGSAGNGASAVTTVLQSGTTPVAQVQTAGTPVAEATLPPPVETSEAVAAAVQAATERAAAITETVERVGLPMSLATSLINSNLTIDQARAQIIDAVAEARSGPEIAGQSRAATIPEGGDAVDKFAEGVKLALMARANLEGGERNQFSGMTLAEIARESLTVRNIAVAHRHNKARYVGQALTVRAQAGHSTSDLPAIMLGVTYKAMLKGFEEAEETFQEWTTEGSLADFKETTRVDLGLFEQLKLKLPGAEYKLGRLNDRSVTFRIDTYGLVFSITREAIINDDLGALTSVPNKLGKAAKRSIGNACYAALTTNPVMPNGHELFSAVHKNLALVSGPPTTATLNAMRTAMATQKDPDDEAAGGLNIRARRLLVPVALEGKARETLGSEKSTEDGDKETINSVRNMAEVISDARLDDDSPASWYGIANKDMYDTVEVSYLDGEKEPWLEEEGDFNTDGVKVKVRHDFGVTPAEVRTMYKNNG